MEGVFIDGANFKGRKRVAQGYLIEQGKPSQDVPSLNKHVKEGKAYKMTVQEETDSLRVELEYSDEGRQKQKCRKVGPDVLEEHEVLKNSNDPKSESLPMPQACYNSDKAMAAYGISALGLQGHLEEDPWEKIMNEDNYSSEADTFGKRFS